MTDTQETRSFNYKKQLKGSAVFKLGAVLATFLAMPIMIDYLGAELFGVWATMLTLLTWVMLFDLGIGNGLRNKITESLAKKRPDTAAEYISTAYGLVGLISLMIFLVFLIGNVWLPWQKVFNTTSVPERILSEAVVTLGFFIFLNFWISLVNQVYQGLQKTSVMVFGQFLSNALALIFVFLLSVYTKGTLIFLIWAYGLSLILSNSILTIYLFSVHKEIRPKIILFDFGKVRALFSLGMRFFIIQLAVLVIFMSDKILITQLLGPQYVTSYEVIFKLFSVFTVLHAVVLAPLWPAYSDAHAKGDMDWIRKQLKKQIKFASLIFVMAILLALVGPLIVKLWIGEDGSAPHSLHMLFAFFIIVSVWNNVFAYFVNAINELSVQLWSAILAGLLNIPLSIFLVKYVGMGVGGVVMATLLSLSIYSFIGPLQVLKIIKE
ncbi:Membrane protein involved in the export of O-antigen and teichoic acid [Pseudomonas guineae]|uniref:Membrane protein involved in the export of O-antigen and teichoic acid n=1 Tax=Pseudomonas guineae TaxID=425504 RepID=A0A1I3CUL1_9PSED|nr:oligosaccharide flippase family protein [Pseudomonas guineae]SFH78244.1 Membrane protein involved in the export of O-antigen and teichoic acid [Pseudomonas guineae]